LGLGRPEDLEGFPGSGDGRVEDAVGNVVLVGVGDYDFDRVVLQALGLVDRDGVGDLERNDSFARVVVLVAVVIVVDGEADGRSLHPLERDVENVELGEWPVQLDVELDFAGVGGSDVDDLPLEVVVDDRPEAVRLVEQHGIANLVGGDAPADGRVGVAVLEEAVDVVDSVEAVVVKAQDDLVVALGLEERLVEDCRVAVVGDHLGDVVLDVTHLVPEFLERGVLGPVGCRQFEDGRARDEPADDVEPVAELDRLDLVDVTDQHQQLERRLLQHLEQVSVADGAALVDNQQVVLGVQPGAGDLAGDGLECRVLGGNLALKVTLCRVCVRQEQLCLVVEVLGDVVDHPGLAGAGGTVDQSHLRLAEQALEGVLLVVVVDAMRRFVEPALDGRRVAIDTSRCVFLELLQNRDGVVLVALDEDVPFVLHQLTFGVLVVELAVVGRNELGDVAKRLDVGDGGVEHPVGLDVGPHTAGE